MCNVQVGGSAIIMILIIIIITMTLIMMIIIFIGILYTSKGALHYLKLRHCKNYEDSNYNALSDTKLSISCFEMK